MFPNSLAVGVVIPIRGFLIGKARLATHLERAARTELLEHMADAVVDAALGSVAPDEVAIVTSAAEVAAWATSRGLAVLPDPGSLNASADAGRAWFRNRGAAQVVIIHADLPDATSLCPVLPERIDHDHAEVVLVPCHREDGTPVLSIPVDAGFRFAYGSGSFQRHFAEATRLGIPTRVVHDPSLAFDVDVDTDLASLLARDAP